MTSTGSWPLIILSSNTSNISTADSDSGELKTRLVEGIVFPEFVNLTDINGNYISVTDSRGSLSCDKQQPDADCVFELVPYSRDSYRLKGSNGRYMRRFYEQGKTSTFCCYDIVPGLSVYEIILVKDNQVYIHQTQTTDPMYITNRYAELGQFRGLAATYYAGSDCLFTISEPIISKEITSVVYDIPTALMTDVPPLVALHTTVRNDSQTSDVQQTLGYSYMRSKVGTWNNAAGIEIGAEMSFSAGVPFISSVDFSIHITASYTHEWGGSVGEQETVSSSTQITVPAGKKGTATVIVKRQEIDVPFTCKQKTVYLDGTTKYTDKNGVYNNVESYSVDVQVGDWDDT